MTRNFNPPEKEGICNACNGKLYQREDDKADAIRNRLVVYKNQTQPLINYYVEKGLLRRIDGSKDISSIFEDIQKVLEKYD
jgi:adenylate kinase